MVRHTNELEEAMLADGTVSRSIDLCRGSDGYLDIDLYSFREN